MRKHMILDVTLADCQRLTGLADVQRLGHLLAQHGLQIVVYPTPGVEGVVLKESEIDDYLAQMQPQEALKASARGEMVIPDGRSLLAVGMEELQWHFSLEFKAGRIAVNIGGLVDFEFRDQRAWVEPYARRLHGLARALYPELQPALAAVYEFDSRPIFGDVLKRKLKCINWVNIFGPPYVEKYGREFLLGLPGYKTEDLPDGGIFYQLSPAFLTDDPQAAEALRQEVIAYCAQAGLKVTCKAPYYLPGVTSPAPTAPQVSDEELEAYLGEMLAVTLLLDDGTRVKPIYIPWADLTPKQRQMAVEAIRQAAIAEIKRPERKRIRFEFNEIPDELGQMLVELVGWDNPDIEYVQVDMDGRQTGWARKPLG